MTQALGDRFFTTEPHQGSPHTLVSLWSLMIFMPWLWKFNVAPECGLVFAATILVQLT